MHGTPSWRDRRAMTNPIEKLLTRLRKAHRGDLSMDLLRSRPCGRIDPLRVEREKSCSSPGFVFLARFAREAPVRRPFINGEDAPDILLRSLVTIRYDGSHQRSNY
jgi:hypothetical protein